MPESELTVQPAFLKVYVKVAGWLAVVLMGS